MIVFLPTKTVSASLQVGLFNIYESLMRIALFVFSNLYDKH